MDTNYNFCIFLFHGYFLGGQINELSYAGVPDSLVFLVGTPKSRSPPVNGFLRG